MSKPIAKTAAPTSVDALIRRISEEYETLSKQLKIIARYIEQHKDHIGLDGIQQVAMQCGVQPSAVVRFAKHFGYSGYSEMQAIFREGISRQLAPSRTYQSRIRDIISSDKDGLSSLSSTEIASEFLTGSLAGMQELKNSIATPSFKKAVDLLAASDCIWIAASRRSFPVAAYLDYALQHTDKRIGLVTGIGGMQLGQMRSVRKDDVMIAISFSPYAEETISVAKLAVERGAKLIAITDSLMSPLAKLAQASLIVQDNSTFGFRSLTSTMSMAQSLFIALAYTLELPYKSSASDQK
ncbi:MAG: MurR/RpiR family transcriptional regulator [Burkholderiaceae bacterium]